GPGGGARVCRRGGAASLVDKTSAPRQRGYPGRRGRLGAVRTDRSLDQGFLLEEGGRHEHGRPAPNEGPRLTAGDPRGLRRGTGAASVCRTIRKGAPGAR